MSPFDIDERVFAKWGGISQCGSIPPFFLQVNRKLSTLRKDASHAQTQLINKL